jgi:hypothetical protein
MSDDTAIRARTPVHLYCTSGVTQEFSATGFTQQLMNAQIIQRCFSCKAKSTNAEIRDMIRQMPERSQTVIDANGIYTKW